MTTEKQIYRFYNGFHISRPVGNNAFSYDNRKQKSVYVPAIIDGRPWDVRVGDEIVFSEIEDGREKNFCGLQNFIRWSESGREILIFDNHNHAFFFWHWGFWKKRAPGNSRLLHIDQHKDTRKPAEEPPFTVHDPIDLEQVWRYTNFVLNVGNFIPPARQTGLLRDVIFIESAADFNLPIPEFDILDIDLDIFSPEMAYIDRKVKIDFIRQAIAQAPFITIATSPFFIDQKKAIEVLMELFS